MCRERKKKKEERVVEMHYFRTYSQVMGREMECKIYGSGGWPVLYIPCQDGRFYDFENLGMLDVWKPWLQSEQVMVCAIDTVDTETWSNPHGDGRRKAECYENWLRYITDEVVPFLQDYANRKNKRNDPAGIMAFGCSLGATHAVNLYLRRPDLFNGLLALSGIYTAEYGFGWYMDDIVYQNSPIHFMKNFPKDHHYVEIYNRQKAVICAGQGAWEIPDSTRELKSIFEEKGIHIWVDLWGYDVSHDWYWWYKQVEYFLPYLLEK